MPWSRCCPWCFDGSDGEPIACADAEMAPANTSGTPSLNATNRAAALKPGIRSLPPRDRGRVLARIRRDERRPFHRYAERLLQRSVEHRVVRLVLEVRDQHRHRRVRRRRRMDGTPRAATYPRLRDRNHRRAVPMSTSLRRPSAAWRVARQPPWGRVDPDRRSARACSDNASTDPLQTPLITWTFCRNVRISR